MQVMGESDEEDSAGKPFKEKFWNDSNFQKLREEMKNAKTAEERKAIKDKMRAGRKGLPDQNARREAFRSFFLKVKDLPEDERREKLNEFREKQAKKNSNE